MLAPKLHKTRMHTADGGATRLEYDETEDMLDVFFGENDPATGVELTDQILLRIDQQTGRPVSLTLLHFSILTERTEFGPRSFPLTALDDLPRALRNQVLGALTELPVSQFLKLSSFQESPTKHVPTTYVDADQFASVS